MPITDHNCPNCGDPIHTDGLIDGVHHIGCGEPFREYMDFDEQIRKKEWVNKEDIIELHENATPENEVVTWTHETFIAYSQIQAAFEDDDVEVGDIETQDCGPLVYLIWQGEE